jgi:hypothetical protein
MAMKPTVCVETSVISYLTAQVSRDLVVAAHQQLTAEWWEQALPTFEPFVSPVVLEEIGRGDPDAASFYKHLEQPQKAYRKRLVRRHPEKTPRAHAS